MSLIASNLKLLREEASLTIEELSEKTGINISLIEGFENNKYVPNEYQLEILCKILKMPADEIGERDLVLERKTATTKMRSKANRENFNWYFGDKKRFMFYLGYVMYFLFGISILILYYLHKFEGLTMDSLRIFWMQTSSLSFPGFVIQFFISHTRIGLSIFGIGVSIFILLDYFSRHTFVFQIWYLFWLTTIILLLQLIGIFGSIPYFIYVICRLIKRKY